MSRKSFLSTIWHCNLTAPWPTLCHCWGDSLNNPMLTITYYCCLTWRSLGVLYNKVRSQTLVKHLVYGPLDYSPLAFYVHSSFLGCFFCVPKFCFVNFFFLWGDFCHLVGWLSNGFTFQDVSVYMLIIHKVKELLAKMKVSVLVI